MVFNQSDSHLKPAKNYHHPHRYYKNKTVWNTAGEAIINIDQSGTILLFNPAAEELFGYNGEEVLGKNIKILVPKAYRDKHNKCMADYSAKKKDGATFPFFLYVGKTLVEGESRFYRDDSRPYRYKKSSYTTKTY